MGDGKPEEETTETETGTETGTETEVVNPEQPEETTETPAEKPEQPEPKKQEPKKPAPQKPPKEKKARKNPEPQTEESASEPETIAPETAQIYIGPSLAGGKLTRFTVFRGGIPAYLQSLLESEPKLKYLIVPVPGLSKAMMKLRTPGTTEFRIAQKLRGGR